MGLPRTPKKGKELDDEIENGSKNESMSFNCKKCKEKLDDNENSVRCDACLIWIHIKCANLTIKDLESITKLGEKTRWFCETCSPNIDGMINENKKLRNELEKLRVEINQLKLDVAPIESNIHDKINAELDIGFHRMKEAMSDIGERIKAVEKDNDVIQTFFGDFEDKLKDLREDLKTEIREETQKIFEKNSDTNTSSIESTIQVEKSKQADHNQFIEQIRKSVQEKFDDGKDKENRKYNLIVYNIKESNYENEERNADSDFEICSKIIYEELSVEDFRIIHMMRLGKNQSNGKPRPILIQLRSEREKWEILRKAKNLRNSRRFGIIYISRDMTLAERKADKVLREEMSSRREKGEDCFIKNGVVIPRTQNIRMKDSTRVQIGGQVSRNLNS